jgi:hypothetical protein
MDFKMDNASLAQITVTDAPPNKFVINACKGTINLTDTVNLVLRTVYHVKNPEQNAQVVIQTWFSIFSQNNVFKKNHVMGQTIGIILMLNVMNVQLKDVRNA